MLTVDDVLSIRHPDPPRWSPDGARLAFPYIIDGVRELWTTPSAGGKPVRVSAPGQVVGAWCWAPDGRLTYAVGKAVFTAQIGEAPVSLLEAQEPIADLKWSPDGHTLAVLRTRKLMLLRQTPPLLRELPAPGPIWQFGWSPDSTRIACLFIDGKQIDAAAIDVATGSLVWRSQTADCEMGVVWVGSDRLAVVRLSLDSHRREHLLVSLRDGSEEIVEREASHKGLKPEVNPIAAPTGDAIACTMIVDGWAHVVVRDLARGSRTVVLPGDHEDYGHAADQPEFSPDGRYLAFSSSKGALQQRQLWRYDRQTGAVLQITTEAGTNVNPTWSPDGAEIAYATSGPWHSVEVAVVGSAGAEGRVLTNSMPEAWVGSAIAQPQHLTFPSAEGLEVHADLFLPHDFDPSRKYPALVYVHGGPSRQMRYGWHPMHAYGFFYSYNQYLLHKGYVILSVDYRGGTGYGEAYEQGNYLKFAQTELEDCVNGGRYLKALPYVDADRVGIWGISYGGYMTLAAMTKHPDEFALGINLAGIWDFEQWARWIEALAPGYPILYRARWGGPKAEANAEVYRHMSPKHWAAGLKAPLLNLHGTEDEAVDFAQLNAVIKDLTALGKDFAALYYPGETHLFHMRTTWEDAFRRIEAAFDRYLNCEPSKRPTAMI